METVLTLGKYDVYVHCSKHLREHLKETVLTLGVAIPAADLTKDSVILFERVKAMIPIALMHLSFGGYAPLSYVKYKACHFCLPQLTVLSSI